MSRGRDATAPTEIPAKGWKDVFWRVKSELAEDHIGLISAGVAFYALLALFPTITALMALAGLILEPSDITEQMATVAAVMPEAAAEIVLDQALSVAGSGSTGVGLAFVFSLGLALYSASRGVASLVEGLNVAYDETETRGFFKLLATNLALTGLMVVGLIAGLVATLAVPAALSWIGLPDWAETAVGLASWVVLGLLTITGLAALYRWGPDRADAKWRWLTPGAMASAALWLIASIGFSVYVSNFSSYNESFGSMAGVIILLTWLWLSAYIVLLGAELNSEIEAQTAKDSTTGPAQPMGERGAEKADSLGEQAD